MQSRIEAILIAAGCLLTGAALGLGIDWLEVKYEDRRIRRKYGEKKK